MPRIKKNDLSKDGSKSFKSIESVKLATSSLRLDFFYKPLIKCVDEDK